MPIKSTEQAALTPTKLIVLAAFVRDEEGELRPAFDARECQSEGQAKQEARLMAALGKYEGVVAWWRSADLVNGEFGEPVEIYRWGVIPDMD